MQYIHICMCGSQPHLVIDPPQSIERAVAAAVNGAPGSERAKAATPSPPSERVAKREAEEEEANKNGTAEKVERVCILLVLPKLGSCPCYSERTHM